MKLSLGRYVIAMIFAMSVVASGRVFAQNLVNNSGFETGSFSGWVETGNLQDTSVVFTGTVIPTNFPPGHDTVKSQSGNYTAVLGAENTPGALSQTISTIVGDSYIVSFYYGSDGGNPNDLNASFGSNLGFNAANIPLTNGYQYATFTTVATSRFTSLGFNFLNDPGYLFLDTVSVTPVPEPSTVVQLFVVIGLLFGVVTYRGTSQRKLRTETM